MKIARIICWQLDSTLRPTIEARNRYESRVSEALEDDLSATKETIF